MNVYLLAAVLILSFTGIVAIPPLVSPEAMDALTTTVDWLSEHALQITMGLSVIGIVICYFMKKTGKMLIFVGMLLISIVFRM